MRKEFLEYFTSHPFPAAPEVTFSVSRWCASAHKTAGVWLAGRLYHFGPNPKDARQIIWRIGTQDHRLSVLTPGAITLNAKPIEARQVLQPQDWIAFRVESSPALLDDAGETAVAADAVQLLVPSQGEPLQTRMDVGVARLWADYLHQFRSFFRTRGFIELRTPTLVSSPGLEPYLDPFKTELLTPTGERQSLYLPTSPEFHLKKALSLGYDLCFEFKECFRNNELSQTHQPEFLMLEWYRAFSTLNAILKDLDELLKDLSCQSAPPLEVLTMQELWRRALGVRLEPHSTAEDLGGASSRDGDDFDDMFHLLFLEKIEPFLKSLDRPVAVVGFPPSQAALARLTSDGWADRVELYWKGLEIANGFHELNDPAEQLRRFRADQEKKKALGKEVVPIDEEFMQALRWGMPPAAGIALGAERLFMALHDLPSLQHTRLFPKVPGSRCRSGAAEWR